MSYKHRFIRKASLATDAAKIMEIFSAAREIMRSTGNIHQWSDGYPSLDIVRADIARDDAYVVVDDGVVVAYFAFLPSPEPTYAHIYDGQWTDGSTPYHVIHRMASLPDSHGVFGSIIDFCLAQACNLRIDTHRDNHIMRHLIGKYGFTYCGIIFLANGDERLAYQRLTDLH